jgi:protein-S-isoprenylcysteine O-methyltransferase Ste14
MSYARLARIEEEGAIARFGDGYLGYAAVTPRFLPFPRPRPVQSSA